MNLHPFRAATRPFPVHKVLWEVKTTFQLFNSRAKQSAVKTNGNQNIRRGVARPVKCISLEIGKDNRMKIIQGDNPVCSAIAG
jgi:hypothetical protein